MMRFYPNQRLSISSQLCTVRYVGDVEGTCGLWVGVEWDDPTRGKHDGTYHGRRYYSCASKNQNAASFIRPNRAIDNFLSFADALKKKHVHLDSMLGVTAGKPIYFNNKLAEEIGFEKFDRRMANLHDLEVVSLEGLCIKGLLAVPCLTTESVSAGWREQAESLSVICPNVRQLDVGRNLLESIIDIQGLCSALPNLISLNVSGNRLWQIDHIVEGDGSKLKMRFSKMTELGMDFTFVPWKAACHISKLFPCLRRFTFACNGIDEIDEPLPAPVTTLTVAGNAFSSLQKITALSKMTTLETLILHDCPIRGDMETGSRHQFNTVKTLDVSKTQLTSHDLGSLHLYFPNLSSLRCTLGTEEHALIVIARLAGLSAINHATISPQHRLNAELYYLNSIAKELEATPQSEESTILAKHPRWMELCELHGEPLINRSVVSGMTDNSLQTRIINLICRDCREVDGIGSSNTTPDTFYVRLPRSFSMYRVYMHIAQRLDTLPILLRIVLETGEWDPINYGNRDERQYNKQPQNASRLEMGITTTPVNGDEGWSSSTSDTSEGEELNVIANYGKTRAQSTRKLKRRMKREASLEQSIQELGFWIEGHSANIRVESRKREDRQ